jgi:hypothetical protein
MKECDMLDGKRCGVRDCGKLAQHERYAIQPVYALDVMAKVAVLLCDEHAHIADTEPTRIEMTGEAKQ